MQRKFFESSLNALFGKYLFLYSVVLFLEFNNIDDFSLGTFLERSSSRIKFKLLLQLKKTLTKKWWK